MPPQPSPKLTLPVELLASIFKLVSPDALAVSTRCSKRFYEICNPLLYREVNLHTPPQLIALSEDQGAMRMLESTETLTVDDFALYLEAWDSAGVNEPSSPIRYLLPVLRAATSLRSFKVSRSCIPVTFSKRVDWGEESEHKSELIRAAGDPEFLHNLTLISVFNCTPTDKSWFEALCYDRVIECYSIWNDTNLHVKIFPGLERTDAIVLGPRLSLSPSIISRLTSYPKRHISGRDVGQLVWESVDPDSRLNIVHLGLQLHFPDAALHDKPSHIYSTFSWLKDVLSTAECPQLQGFHVRSKSLPLDRTASLDAQRLGLEELQTTAPTLAAVGMSSTRKFWRRWIPELGKTYLYSTVHHWTPCPDMDPHIYMWSEIHAMLAWWLNAVGIDTSDIQDRTVLEDSAKQLSAVMQERWDYMAPTESTLRSQLSIHFPVTTNTHSPD